MKWINVKDRLPEEFWIDRYLQPPWVLVVLIPIPLISIARFKDGKWEIGSLGYTPADQEMIINSSYLKYKVTHWMPLPEPPHE